MKNTAPTMHSAAHRKSSLGGCRIYNTANGTNTVSVIASWRILSCGSDNSVVPSRFAGINERVLE